MKNKHKAHIAKTLSLLIPGMTTFGRTGIVVQTLQVNKLIVNPEEVVALTGIAIAISYWALFSGYSYGYVKNKLDQKFPDNAINRDNKYNDKLKALIKNPFLKNFLQQHFPEEAFPKDDEALAAILENLVDEQVDEKLNAVIALVEDYINSPATKTRLTKIGAKTGFISGVMLAISEGVLNFLGTRHLIMLMGSQNDGVNIFFPTIFALSSLWCWYSMVTQKAESFLEHPSKIFAHDLTGWKNLMSSSIGGFTGSIAGLGLGGTATFGIFQLLKIIEDQTSTQMPPWSKLLIALPFTLGSFIAASSFYMNTNSNLIGLFTALKNSLYTEKMVIDTAVDDHIEYGGQLGNFKTYINDRDWWNVARKLFQWTLCLFVLGGGAYATYTLSLVSIRMAIFAMENMAEGSQSSSEENNLLELAILWQLASVCLAFTATAVSGRRGCELILSESEPKLATHSDIEEENIPLLETTDSTWKPNFFRGFYNDSARQSIAIRESKDPEQIKAVVTDILNTQPRQTIN